MEVGSPGFLERESEEAVIEHHLDRACCGEGSLVVVEGPAGIGKTTLLRRAMASARSRQMTVIYGRGGVLEREIEFGVVRQLLEKPLISVDQETREALLAGPARPAGSVLGLGEIPDDMGPGSDPVDNIFHGIYWLMANLAEETPILAVFDDAHWGDQASLLASGYLARRVEGHPIAMLTAVRNDEPDSRADTLGPIFLEAGARMLHPGPLSAGAILRVVTEAFPEAEISQELVDALERASGGNPFFLTELIGELSASHQGAEGLSAERVFAADPLAVRRSLLMRLGSLGEESRVLAQALSILGGEGELRQASSVGQLTPSAAAVALDRLTAARIVGADSTPRLAHPLIRGAIADDLSPSSRAILHRRAFEAMTEAGATDDEASVHALAAGPAGDARLVALLRRTAEKARRSGAPSTAVRHLARALAEPPDPGTRSEVLAELGRAEVRSGEFGAGLDHIDAALPDLSDETLRIAVQRDRGFAAFASGGMDRARELVHASLSDLDDPGSDGAMRLEADLAMLAWLSGTDSGIDLRRHLGLRGDSPAERTILALLAQELHATGSPPDEVIGVANRALGGGRMVAEDTSEALGWYMATYALLTCEAYDDARTTIEQALADSHRRGSAFGRSGALGCRAVLAINEGRPRDAEADSRAAASGAMAPIMVPVNASFTVRALVEQGKLDEAEQELREGGIESGPGGPTVLRWIPWGRACLHEAQGDLPAVREDVAPLEADDRAGRSMKALSWRALLARSISRHGYSEEGEALAGEHLRWAEWWARPTALGIAQRASGLAGPAELRSERLEQAVETLSRSSLRTEEARARVELGIALLRTGRKSDGRRQLEAGLELAMACGSRIPAEIAAEELKVSGAAPRRLSFDRLTASENRVAEYAAGGMTNRQIADELFVTPKTVENHLTRVYSKLGISSRSDLESALT
jgi:DNA-binding NarL/FixJ family response regulator